MVTESEKSELHLSEEMLKIENLQLALEKSREKYDRMLENLQEEFLFFSHDVEGNFTYASPSLTRILGYSVDEYFSMNFQNHWTPNPINKTADLHSRKSIQGIKQPPYEMEIYHKNGTYRRFITIETPVFNEYGEVISVEGTARDVTEKKKTEEKLRKYREHLEELVQQRTAELEYSRKQLFDIIDFLPIPTFVTDKTGVIISWNRAIEELFGMKKEDVMGNSYRECIKPFHDNNEVLPVDLILECDNVITSLKNHKSESDKFIERYLEKLRDGEGVHAWIAAAPMLDSENNITGAIATYRDVTHIKKAERQIRESELRLSTLMSNLPGMAYRIVKRSAWRVDFVSSGAKSILGNDASFFVGKELDVIIEMIHPEDIARIKDQLETAFNKKKPFHNEYRIISESGEIKWVFDRGEFLYGEDLESFTVEGFISDFTFYKEMEKRLRNENLLLRSSIKDRFKFDNIIGNSEPMQKVYDLIMKAATTDDAVSIYGESGTGKELIAKAIHNASERKDHNFIVVNCGAIPENLIESEFFGTMKGAFTGANRDKKGLLEIADRGTLFLDEIGEISLNFQVKLLRAIDDGGFTPIGGRQLIKPDIRIIAASNKNLFELVRNGAMRNDFFFRIHVIPINLPPLRERGEDLFFLIDHFLKLYSKSDRLQTLSRAEIEMLRSYGWPGNVRELQNVLRRYVTFKKLILMPASGDEKSTGSDSQIKNYQIKELSNEQSLKKAIESFEKSYITELLHQNRWHKSRTAKLLGVSRKTLFRKLQAYGLLDTRIES